MALKPVALPKKLTVAISELPAFQFSNGSLLPSDSKKAAIACPEQLRN